MPQAARARSGEFITVWPRGVQVHARPTAHECAPRGHRRHWCARHQLRAHTRMVPVRRRAAPRARALVDPATLNRALSRRQCAVVHMRMSASVQYAYSYFVLLLGIDLLTISRATGSRWRLRHRWLRRERLERWRSACAQYRRSRRNTEPERRGRDAALRARRACRAPHSCPRQGSQDCCDPVLDEALAQREAEPRATIAESPPRIVRMSDPRRGAANSPLLKLSAFANRR